MAYKSLDEFLQDAQWQPTPGPIERANMQRVLDYFQSIVPEPVLNEPCGPTTGPTGRSIAFRPTHGRWTRLMGWMQSIRFSAPVKPSFLVPRGGELIAFRTPEEVSGRHRFGNFYALADNMSASGTTGVANQSHMNDDCGWGIPSTQNIPIRYVAARSFGCLSSEVADAFLGWIDPKAYARSYARGGRQQLFIYRPDLYLVPQF